MKISFKFAIALAVIAAGVVVFAPAPDASDAHFVIVNDNDYYGKSQGTNYGTVLRLDGTKQNPDLKQAAALATGEPSVLQGPFTPTVQVVRRGSDVCIFLADSAGPQADTPNEVTSFRYPSMTPVGSFSDSQVSSAELGIVIAAYGDYLFAAYDGYQTTSYLATWQIGSGCTLTLLGTYEIPYQIFSMAATPSGNALLASYMGGGTLNGVDSFVIGSGGVLTETGPYGLLNAKAAWGLDITADSKMAIFTMQGFGPPYDDGETEINTFVVNSNGSLGQQGNFGADGSLGTAYGGGWIRLSPNEKFLFVTADVPDDPVTTLNFSENPLNVSWSGCLTTLKIHKGAQAVLGQGIATLLPMGGGGGIAIAEGRTIGLLAVNPGTGCLTEAPESPFALSDKNSGSASLVSWPPRGF